MLLPVRRLAEKKLFLYLFIFPLETGKGGEGTASFSEAEAKEISAHPLVDWAGLASSTGAGQRRTRPGPGLQGAPDTVRDSSGSSTGSRPDTTAQLGETSKGLKEFRHEVVAQEMGVQWGYRGWKAKVHISLGEQGGPGGPVKEEVGAGASGFWMALHASGRHPQERCPRTSGQGGAGRGEAGTDVQLEMTDAGL